MTVTITVHLLLAGLVLCRCLVLAREILTCQVNLLTRDFALLNEQ